MMKQTFFTAISGFALLFAILFVGCQQEEGIAPNGRISTRSPHITYSQDPLCYGETVTVTFNTLFGAANDCGKATIWVWGPTDTDWVSLTPGGSVVTDGILAITYTPTQGAGDYRFRAHYVHGGGCDFANLGPLEETPLEVVLCGCTIEGNTLTGSTTTSCGSLIHTATYTLCSEDGIAAFHLQGGLTNFTGADATIVGPGDISQHTPGNSTNRIVEIDGSLEECTCATWIITWGSSNTNNQVTGGWSAVGFGGDLFVPVLNCN